MENFDFRSAARTADVAVATSQTNTQTTPQTTPQATTHTAPSATAYGCSEYDPFDTPAMDEVMSHNTLYMSGDYDSTPFDAEPAKEPTAEPATEYEITDDDVAMYASSHDDYEAYIAPTATATAPAHEQSSAPAQQSAERFDYQAELDRQFADKMRQEIEPYLIRTTDNLPPLIPVLTRHKRLLCSEGNISAVVGEAKSKKTFLCTAMVGSMLDMGQRGLFGIDHNWCKVLWVDTEQSPAHIQKVMFRINVLGRLPYNAPDNRLKMLHLREKSPKDRLTALSYGIAIYSPKLVVVDGVSDLMNNTNNLEESEALVSELLNLSSVGNCHIMCVLHANPNSDKARGHLGSTLMRKAETVMFVHKTGETSIVEPQHCRNEEFDRFAFRIDEAENADLKGEPYLGLGIPVECDLPNEGSQKEDDCVRILRDEFGGVASKRLLHSKLSSVLGIPQNHARMKVCRALSRGLLSENEGVVSVVNP